MKSRCISLILPLSLLAGCATPVFYHSDPARHVIVLDRHPVSILQTGDDQWQAWGAGSSRSPGNNEQLQRQISAIEIVSRCTVIKSVLDPEDARKLTATVRCPSLS